MASATNRLFRKYQNRGSTFQVMLIKHYIFFIRNKDFFNRWLQHANRMVFPRHWTRIHMRHPCFCSVLLHATVYVKRMIYEENFYGMICQLTEKN